jgi:hypothetical protein
MWPRRLDGTFAIPAVVDHLLGLVREELENPWPVPPVARGVPVAASGVHVMHAAAVLLGAVSEDASPAALVERVAEDRVRRRIQAHTGERGLTDGDLRALGDALGLFVSRCMKFDGFDPFEPVSGDIVSVLRLGRQAGPKVELSYVLLLDRRAGRVKLAPPGVPRPRPLGPAARRGGEGRLAAVDVRARRADRERVAACPPNRAGRGSTRWEGTS